MGACTKTRNVRGYVPDPERISELRPGVDNKESVIALLGHPSTIATFDDDTWYYIHRRTERLAFFREKPVEAMVLALHFDSFSNIETVTRYGLEDARDVNLISKKTPTRGKELGFFEQIFGNLGRFSSSTGNNP